MHVTIYNAINSEPSITYPLAATVMVKVGTIVPLLVDRLNDIICFLNSGDAHPSFNVVLPAVMKISSNTYDMIEHFDHNFSMDRYLSVAYFAAHVDDVASEGVTSLFSQQIKQIQNYSTDEVFRTFLWTSSVIKDLSDECIEYNHCDALQVDLIRADVWSQFEQSLEGLSGDDSCGFKKMTFQIEQVGPVISIAILTPWIIYATTTLYMTGSSDCCIV